MDIQEIITTVTTLIGKAAAKQKVSDKTEVVGSLLSKVGINLDNSSSVNPIIEQVLAMIGVQAAKSEKGLDFEAILGQLTGNKESILSKVSGMFSGGVPDANATKLTDLLGQLKDKL